MLDLRSLSNASDNKLENEGELESLSCTGSAGHFREYSRRVDLVEAERRQVAVLFTDMVGFTTYSQQRGEEEAFTLMRSLTRLMDGAVQEQGGVVHGFTGDGVLAVFGAPVAFEDAPLRACRAALTILQRLTVTGDDLEAEHGVRPQVRIGISAGPVVFGRVQGGVNAGVTVLGDAVNVAARLETLADPGSAMISEALHRLVAGLVDASFAGEKPIKGRTGTEKVYRLNAIRTGGSRFDATRHRGLTSYIGRDRELESLESNLDTVVAGLRVIDIVGDAGIGKSRLLHEFREQIVKERVRVLTGSCTSDGQRTPFSAFIDITRGAVHLLPGDEHLVVARKLDDALQALGLSTSENVGLLLNMLGLEAPKGALWGLDGVLIGLRTRDLLRQIVKAGARLTPVIIIFEDLHWLDTASEELLASLIEISEPMQLLILHTRRPEYAPRWLGSQRVTELALEPLSARETSRIAQARLGVNALPDALAKLIAAKAEGNALFAEEIASFLVERGIVRRIANSLEFDPEAVAAALPDSVQSLLASRVDRLAPADRELLQAAAVIGRRFDPDLVVAVSGTQAPDETSFVAMETLDLVRRDERSGDYVFKHSLVRDALYSGLLAGPRVALHLKVAEELERRSANRLFEIAEALAHHYAAAQRANKAFVYLAMAGQKSLNVYAIQEAEQYCRQALGVFEVQPECATSASVVPVVVRLLETLLLKSDYRDAGEVARKYMSFVKEAGETPDLVTAYYYQALSLVQNFELRAAHALMIEALAVAERLGDGRACAYARGGLLQCRTRLGLDSLEDADRMKAQLMDDSRRFGDNFIRNASYFFVIWDYLYRGLFKEAREMARRLVASGEERNDPRAIGVANWVLGWIELFEGAHEAATTHADDCLRVAIAPIDRLQGAIIKVASAIFLGRVREGLSELEALNSKLEQLGALYSVLHLPRGVALIAVGQISEGIDVIVRFIAQRDAAGDHTFAAFGRVLLAEVYIQLLSRKQTAPAAVLLKNFWFLVGTRLFGMRRALALLQNAASHKQFSESGVIIARVNFNLGVLSAMKRKRETAKAFFERARATADRQGEEALLKKIDAAMSGLR
jgi:class 3 adenylate cyclase